jgi:eukaryotic-like serine/threonine-protein kinase
MALSTDDLLLLSRLLDEALRLQPGERKTWLQALPAEAKQLRARLERALLEDAPDAVAPRFDGPLPLLESGSSGQPGERIGPWRLLHLLGRGGMGSVWAAERGDGLYERQVALKLPRVAHGRDLAKRMAQEQRIAALLEHPGIARLYDAGVDAQGRPYLVMERVDGVGLADYAQAHGLGLQGRLRLVLQVTQALAHAHRLLVVHRDIKPGNLLVDHSGQVKLLDFGVARLLDDSGAQTSGTLSDTAHTHTPRYAAPEQTQGGPVGTSSDLYALALVLHELLTGALPAAAGADGTTAQHTRPPVRVAPGLPPALRAVLARALEPDPALRQASVAHFADELRAVLAQQVPASWNASRTQRLRLWASRHRAGLSWAGLAAVGAAVAAVLLLMQHWRAQEQLARLDQARAFMFQTLWDALPVGGAVPGAAAPHVERALQRARRELDTQPVLQAEVFNEIAVLLRNLGQGGAARELLQQAHAQMQQHAQAHDPGRHIVAAQLATQLLVEGSATSTSRAAELALAAQQGCSAASRRCAKARAYALSVQGQLAARQGHNAAALSALVQSLSEHETAFGTGHPETTLLRLDVAATLRNDSQLQPALDELQRADEAVARQPLAPADEAHRATLHAVLLADLGRHDEALARTEALLSALPIGAPDTAAASLARRLRAQSLLALGLWDRAAEAAEQAAAAAAQADNGWETLAARQVQVLAAAARGRLPEAAHWLQAVQDLLQRQSLGPTSGPARAAQRARAELDLRAGHAEQADMLLERLLSAAPAAMPPLERARVLALRATAARLRGEPAQALALHRQAAALWSERLPPEHPLRLRNAFEQAWAEVLSSTQPQQREGMLQTLQTTGSAWAARLPKASAWHESIDAISADPVGTRQRVL